MYIRRWLIYALHGSPFLLNVQGCKMYYHERCFKKLADSDFATHLSGWHVQRKALVDVPPAYGPAHPRPTPLLQCPTPSCEGTLTRQTHWDPRRGDYEDLCLPKRFLQDRAREARAAQRAAEAQARAEREREEIMARQKRRKVAQLRRRRMRRAVLVKQEAREQEDVRAAPAIRVKNVGVGRPIVFPSAAAAAALEGEEREGEEEGEEGMFWEPAAPVVGGQPLAAPQDPTLELLGSTFALLTTLDTDGVPTPRSTATLMSAPAPTGEQEEEGEGERPTALAARPTTKGKGRGRKVLSLAEFNPSAAHSLVEQHRREGREEMLRGDPLVAEAEDAARAAKALGPSWGGEGPGALGEPPAVPSKGGTEGSGLRPDARPYEAPREEVPSSTEPGANPWALRKAFLETAAPSSSGRGVSGDRSHIEVDQEEAYRNALKMHEADPRATGQASRFLFIENLPLDDLEAALGTTSGSEVEGFLSGPEALGRYGNVHSVILFRPLNAACVTFAHPMEAHKAYKGLDVEPVAGSLCRPTMLSRAVTWDDAALADQEIEQRARWGYGTAERPSKGPAPAQAPPLLGGWGVLQQWSGGDTAVPPMSPPASMQPATALFRPPPPPSLPSPAPVPAQKVSASAPAFQLPSSPQRPPPPMPSFQPVVAPPPPAPPRPTPPPSFPPPPPPPMSSFQPVVAPPPPPPPAPDTSRQAEEEEIMRHVLEMSRREAEEAARRPPPPAAADDEDEDEMLRRAVEASLRSQEWEDLARGGGRRPAAASAAAVAAAHEPTQSGARQGLGPEMGGPGQPRDARTPPPAGQVVTGHSSFSDVEKTMFGGNGSTATPSLSDSFTTVHVIACFDQQKDMYLKMTSFGLDRASLEPSAPGAAPHMDKQCCLVLFNHSDASFYGLWRAEPAMQTANGRLAFRQHRLLPPLKLSECPAMIHDALHRKGEKVSTQ